MLYETLFIVHPEKGPRLKEFIDKFKKVIETQQGAITHVEEWGLRDLAYRIQKQGKGVYTLLRYHATGRAVEELERNLKLTDGILRYLTVRAEEQIQAAAAPVAKAQTEEESRVAQEPAEKPEVPA